MPEQTNLLARLYMENDKLTKVQERVKERDRSVPPSPRLASLSTPPTPIFYSGRLPIDRIFKISETQLREEWRTKEERG